MSYLDFINKLGLAGLAIEDLKTGDSLDVGDAVQELYGNNKISDAEEQKFVPALKGTDGNLSGPWRSYRQDPPADFQDGKLLKYPNDLFQPGNTSYIYFQIKESAPQIGEIAKFIAGVSQPDLGAALAKLDPLEPAWGSAKDPLKRIALYMPGAIKSNYGTVWEDSQLQVRRNFGIAKDMFRDASTFFDNLNQITGRIGDGVTGGTSFQNDAEFMSKKILDPQNALLFKGVDFREFQFDFQMMARNETEADEIRKIIKTFKWAMHPGQESTNGALWKYPHFFEIYLCTPSRKHMFNIMNSALKGMEVDYGGSGVPSFFRANGAPVDIRLSLTFRELFVLTQDMILNDY